MSKNPVIGHWNCPLGAKADVHQNAGHGHHFYTNCECHGWVRRNTPERQQAIWDSATFLNGAAVKRPTNVKDSGKPAVNEPEKLEKPEEPESEDFDPAAPEKPEKPDSEQEEPEGNGGGIAAKIIGVGVLALSGVGAWLWTRD